MEFDINKYNNTTFSDDDLTHKRIKVLLLWFEYEVDKNDLSLELQIKLMRKWINMFEQQEYYEVIPFFKQKMVELVNYYSDTPKHVPLPKTVNLTAIDVSDSFLIRVMKKIKKWYRLKFKRK